MRKASGAYRAALPESLRERLALLEWGVLPVPPPRARVGVQRAQRKPGRRLVGVSFGLGLVCGGALGGAALFVQLLANPTQRPVLQTAALPDASARLDPLPSREHQAPSFEMTLSRGNGGKAPLPLRITGVDGAENVHVMLRNLPATAWLSGGERQDDHTWSLRVADLENLQVMLGEGTPETFDLAIEVASPATGAQLASAVAHVRLSDQPQVAANPVPPPTLAAGPPHAPVIDTPFRTEVTAVPQPEEPTRTAQARPPLPDGLSSLGGPTGGPAPPSEHRTVWWKLPPPAWTPFADRIGPN